MSAAPTPPEVLDRLKQLTGAPSWEDLAVELGVGARLLGRWRAGDVQPGWKHAVMLLHRAGYLLNGDEAFTVGEIRQQTEELRQARELLESVIRRAEQQAGEPGP